MAGPWEDRWLSLGKVKGSEGLGAFLGRIYGNFMLMKGLETTSKRGQPFIMVWLRS
jgi:hypothetical protein